MNARDAVVTALMKIHEQDSYSNIVLDEMLERSILSDSDRAFATRLLYGVVERRLTLDYLLNKASDTPVKQMTAAVREILRTATYQMVYMSKIPHFAVIHEAVEQTRTFRCAHLGKFVNAVLRHVERRYADYLNDLPQTDKGLELRYSVPREWIRIWRIAYGHTATDELLQSVNDAPPIFIRINTCVVSVEDFHRHLDTCGIAYRTFDGLPEALEIESASALQILPSELTNSYYFQDVASQWSCAALDAQPGEMVADVCAAPGGKSMTVAQYMNNSGSIVAGELHDHRCRMMAERMERYGFTCVSVRQRDASLPPADEDKGIFDRVLCDVPCSGLGVIRRKPEIRYKKPDEFVDLPALQLQILQQSSALVRPGGILQYSTCTLHPAENEDVAMAFLANNPDFEPRLLPIKPCFDQSQQPVSHQITLMPGMHGTDGFYIAGFKRKD